MTKLVLSVVVPIIIVLMVWFTPISSYVSECCPAAGHILAFKYDLMIWWEKLTSKGEPVEY